MRCQYQDCAHYDQGHPACQDCWHRTDLRDRYEPALPYYEQGRICNLLGQVWVEYCQARLTKRHSVRLLALIQQAQMLVMKEEVSEVIS